MLEQLFGSQTRVKLLQLFLNNPEDKFFVRELTRVIDSQINAVRRELENLESMEIIKIIPEELDDKNAKKSRQKFFKANTKFVLYPELKSIIQKSQFLLNRKLANSLKKIGKLYYLALTGYFVGDKDSPIDILIVGKFRKSSVERIIKNFEKNFKREINYTLLDKDEFAYRRSVADRFLYAILDGEKIVMVDEIINPSLALENSEGN
jgi:hypothetical protein